MRRGPVDPETLDERRHFLARSLADADAEYLAGDLTDDDYLALRQRDLARLAALATVATSVRSAPSPSSPGATAASGGTATLTERAPAPEATAAPDAAPPPATEVPSRRRGRNGWFLAGAVVCFAAALIVAVPLFTSDRLPGQTASGSVSLSPSQQLARSLDQAAAAEDEGQLGLAAQLYQAVLTAHPDDEVALAQLGWLEYRIGSAGASTSLVADARTKLDQAAALDPGDYAVHLYLGTVLLQQDGNAAGAVDQFRRFLAAGPPATVLSQAASTVRTAFARDGQPVPAGVPTG